MWYPRSQRVTLALLRSTVLYSIATSALARYLFQSGWDTLGRKSRGRSNCEVSVGTD